MDRVYKVEHQSIYKGYHLVVVFNGAFRCGYVGLPKGHELENKMYYEDIDYVIHGGLTYSSVAQDGWGRDGYYWYLGFDCGHFDDGADIEIMKKYGASELAIEMWSGLNGTVRTKEFVLKELEKLVERIEKTVNKKGE